MAETDGHWVMVCDYSILADYRSEVMPHSEVMARIRQIEDGGYCDGPHRVEPATEKDLRLAGLIQ